jgi:putative transposase
MILVIGLSSFLRSLFGSAAAVALENLALRHQLMVLQRSVGRPRLAPWDRILWVWLSRVWPGWRSRLLIVQPATVLAWHRQGFQLYWRWRSTANRVGRPKLAAEIRHLIHRMVRDNPTWGRRRIRAELALLGYDVAELTVAKYMHRASPRPSPTWRVFLTTHARDIVAIDFFVVPTLTFRLLFVFVGLRHERRELLHLHVTDHPTAVWTARQIIEAFPNETAAPRYLLRDRDAVYGVAFSSRVQTMGIHEVKTAPRSPWQNPHVERLIGTLRRECLDHVVVLNETHLRRLLSAYLIYYHGARTHLSWRRTPRSPDRWSDSTKAESPRRRGRQPPSSLRSASGVSSCLRAVPSTSTAPVGACASVHWNPLLGDSARSQGGPRCVSVVSEAHDHGPQPVPRYLDRLNGSDSPEAAPRWSLPGAAAAVAVPRSCPPPRTPGAFGVQPRRMPWPRAQATASRRVPSPRGAGGMHPRAYASAPARD